MSTSDALLIDHDHGQVNNRCTHPDCQAAYARWTKRWKLDQARGKARTTTGDPVRHHIASLRAAGWSLRAIGATAGVSDTALSDLIRDPERRIRVATAAAVLGINPDTLPTRSTDTSSPMVARAGTQRRIQALLAIGWPHRELEAASGVQTHQVVSRSGTWVRRDTHDAVAAVYRNLAQRPGPSTLTRAQAARLGYAPPAAWDDIDRDLEPWQGLHDDQADDYDEVAVRRRLDGDRTAALTKADRVELVRRARDAGWSYLDIERRAGVGRPDRYLTREDVA